MTLELVVMVPVIVLMLLMVTGLGRISHGRQLVQAASAAAARAASLSPDPGRAGEQADLAARESLRQGGLSCDSAQVRVDTSQFRPGGQVSVSVTCAADLSHLTLAGFPGSVTLRSTSLSPLETYRAFDR